MHRVIYGRQHTKKSKIVVAQLQSLPARPLLVLLTDVLTTTMHKLWKDVFDVTLCYDISGTNKYLYSSEMGILYSVYR